MNVKTTDKITQKENAEEKAQKENATKSLWEMEVREPVSVTLQEVTFPPFPLHTCLDSETYAAVQCRTDARERRGSGLFFCLKRDNEARHS